MHKKTVSTTKMIIVAIFAMLFALPANNTFSAELSVAPASDNLNEFPETKTADLWKLFGSRNTDISQTKLSEQETSVYLVYPEKRKKNTLADTFFKNRSLSISIPLQHKKHVGYLPNEEKKIIKHLSIQTN